MNDLGVFSNKMRNKLRTRIDINKNIRVDHYNALTGATHSCKCVYNCPVLLKLSS